ncbi:MAG: ComEA family DNA-binding protein [Gemmatimonadota bacterium]
MRRLVAFLLALGAVRLALSWTPAAPLLLDPEAGALDSLLTATDSAVADQERRTRPIEDGELLDVNRAGEEELDRLPRVGPGLARAIIAERERGGPFATVEALARVRGVGPATLERLRPHIEVRGVPPSRPLAPPVPGTEAVVSLARATAADLEALPGIGPALARRILATREERGGFASVDDLLAVPGVGPATLARIRARLRVP